jgi:TolB-like protein
MKQLILLLCAVAMLATQAAAQDQEAAVPRLTVAVLEFENATPGDAELGRQISDLLVALMSAEPAFTLVDRASLNRALQELELGASGVVDAAQAARIGRIIGAKVLVTGRAFALDKQIFITARIIGTETSLVEGVVVRGELQADVGQLVMEMSERLSARLREAGPRLIASDARENDPVPALIERLAGRQRPVVAVRIAERHMAARPAPQPIDPAVETEVTLLLRRAGFTVIEGTDRELARAGVELMIVGEAFSEFAARIGNLVSCTARAEVKVTDFNDGRVIHIDRVTTRAADLSENIAGKTALEQAGRAIGVKMLEYFADYLPGGENADDAGA